MPTGAEIPVGLDELDLLPCGCGYEEATAEELVMGAGWFVASRGTSEQMLVQSSRATMVALLEAWTGVPFSVAAIKALPTFLRA